MEAIVEQWEEFARSLYPAEAAGAATTPLALRDHAQQILEAVMADLSTVQSDDEQTEKSMGRAPTRWNAPETAAQTHAVLRAQSGMDINQLAAEYRALRASVFRLWEEDARLEAEAIQDVIRFNEAIDQALAESIGHFSTEVTRSRDLLLGSLGHDLRNPLNAILLTAANLGQLNAGEEVTEAAGLLKRSGASMKALLDDLVDFNRTKLGLGINVEMRETDLGRVFADELEQQRAAHPESRVELRLSGDVTGRWDGQRLQQVLRNLVSNAITYGTPGEPVRVTVQGDEAGVRIAVANRGVQIDPAVAEHLFDPLSRGTGEHRHLHKEGLGLGLFIVREITHDHGGEVDLKSDATETVITVRLPRKP